MIKLLKGVKHFFEHLLLKSKKVVIDKTSHIRKPYSISNGRYIKILGNSYICSHSTLSCFDHYSGEEYVPSIVIENDVFINSYFCALSACRLTIGHDTFIGPNVLVTNENHGLDPTIMNYGLQPLLVGDVIIENNCWIGGHVIILPGVIVGHHSIVGAGSVVTKSIPAYSIAAGNPARVIKKWDFTLRKWINVAE